MLTAFAGGSGRVRRVVKAGRNVATHIRKRRPFIAEPSTKKQPSARRRVRLSCHVVNRYWLSYLTSDKPDTNAGGEGGSIW